MSDRYPAEIHIGGQIQRSLVEELVRKIVETGASLNGYDDGAATEGEIRAGLREGNILSLYDCHAGYGHFHELEEYLIENGIHFNHHCEAYHEYEAENTYYRGGEQALSLPASQQGNLLIRHEEVMRILNNPGLDDQGKLNALTELTTPPETKLLEPIQFV